MADSINSAVPDSTGKVKREKAGDSKYRRPDELLRDYSVTLTNAAGDAGIGQALAGRGYGKDRLSEGASLLSQVNDLFAKQKQEYGEQLEASAALKETFNRADSAYNPSYKIARIAFEDDPNAFTALMLSGTRSKLISVWHKQADTFYRNLLGNGEFVAKMAEYGYTAEQLSNEHALVQEVMAANARHKKEMGESQEATKVRDAAMEKLEVWMSKFYRIARIACAGQQQWLEKLGLQED
ncbi:MAG: hypothetical protein JW768_09535 [Chitinispirillaceae bacterium]|nr:hypothetical protein [Chitinispirillaceae bacterium]